VSVVTLVGLPDAGLPSKAEIPAQTHHECREKVGIRPVLPVKCGEGFNGDEMNASAQQVTQLLGEWRSGDSSALEKLIPLVQPELRRLAQHYMSRERPGHTLQTTALIDDAYLQFANKTHPEWQNRAHFFAVSAQLMRRIMVDHARQRQAAKRGGGAVRVTFDESAAVSPTRADELVALDDALEQLAAFDERKAQVVEMRYFGGLATEEIADVLKIHVNTVTRDWTAARAWLLAKLSGENMDAI
jgi:RNA polymerase sigma-70 factor (ECF subfamily)